jgi:hypothetical protein
VIIRKLREIMDWKLDMEKKEHKENTIKNNIF